MRAPALWLTVQSEQTHTQQLTSVHIITKQKSNALWNICIDKNCASSWNEPVKSYRTQCIRLHCFEPLELISQLFLPDSSLRYLWWWHYFTSLLRSTFSKDSILKKTTLFVVASWFSRTIFLFQWISIHWVFVFGLRQPHKMCFAFNTSSWFRLPRFSRPEANVDSYKTKLQRRYGNRQQLVSTLKFSLSAVPLYRFFLPFCVELWLVPLNHT